MDKLSYSDWMLQNPMGTMLDYNNYANSGTGLYDSVMSGATDSSSMIPTVGYGANTNNTGGLFDGFSASGFNDVTQGAAGLYGMYQGHKMLGLYEDQVKDAQLNSAVNRNEIARRNTVRDNWSTAFQQA